MNIKQKREKLIEEKKYEQEYKQYEQEYKAEKERKAFE